MDNPNLPPPYGAEPLAKCPQGPPSYPQPQPQGPASYPQPYPQGQPTYPQGPTNPYPGSSHTVATYIAPSQPPALVISPVGPQSSIRTCPSCNVRIQTRTETQSNSSTHLWAFLLCILGCWPCCLIPYCVEDCQSVNHYCPICNAYIGSYKAD